MESVNTCSIFHCIISIAVRVAKIIVSNLCFIGNNYLVIVTYSVRQNKLTVTCNCCIKGIISNLYADNLSCFKHIVSYCLAFKGRIFVITFNSYFPFEYT